MPFKLSKTTPGPFPSSRSVLFNGSNQYLSVASNAAFNLSGAFTVECWIYLTSIPALNASNSNGATIARYGIPNNTNQGWEFDMSTGASGGIAIGKTGSGNGFGVSYPSFALNTWYHIAIVYNGTTGTIYLNGTALTNNNNTWSWTAPSGGTPLMTIGALLLYSGYDNYFPGYISNFRVVNGTALYTSNFTPSTSPLTAIANTSLLACNAATIIDSSTNNFTITNNNTATVSSLVPFNVVSYGYKFKNTSNVASVLPGTQKAIFGYGSTGTMTSITNLVSNTGVVENDTTGVGTARYALAAAGYGSDKAIFGYGTDLVTSFSMTNKVSNICLLYTSPSPRDS